MTELGEFLEVLVLSKPLLSASKFPQWQSAEWNSASQIFVHLFESVLSLLEEAVDYALAEVSLVLVIVHL